MTLENLHKAIINGDYPTVESIIIDTNVNPLTLYNGKTAIQLCFAVMRNQPALQTVCNDMLNNLLFPKADRHLIGNHLANRGDIMVLSDEGDIKIVSMKTPIEIDTLISRPIGEDDEFLSKYSIQSFHERELEKLRR